MRKIRTHSKRKIYSKHNSDCVVALDQLDWKNWFSDNTGGAFYLHVYKKDSVDRQCLRVFCKHSEKPRISMENGELFWIIDASMKEIRRQVRSHPLLGSKKGPIS